MGKSNKKFMLLSALGIIMVVDAHAWTALKLFADIIPYNSYLIPAFVFISGYFCKIDESSDILKYIKKKIRKLIVPFFTFSIVVFVIEILINRVKFGVWFLPLNNGLLDTLLRIIRDGVPVKLAAPLWFLPTLFLVECSYAVLRKYFMKIRFWNDFVALMFFVGINMVVVHFAKHNDFSESSLLLILKCGFMMPFYEMGYIYNHYLEERLKNLNHYIIMVALLMINVIRMMCMAHPDDISFNNLSELTGFTCRFSITPVVSSIIGIWFWLTLVELIEPALANDRTMNYISNNAMWILAFHMTMFEILNCVLMYVDKHIVPLEDFDYFMFYDGHWSRWEHYFQFRIVYWAVGLVGSVALKLLYDKIVYSIRQKYPKK